MSSSPVIIIVTARSCSDVRSQAHIVWIGRAQRAIEELTALNAEQADRIAELERRFGQTSRTLIGQP